MAAGDGEFATAFLETSLGTRLAVSFPARATTVADLKRQVGAEHAACFPRSGPIAVTSVQVKLDGSWFVLTDSMAVQDAFQWVKGPWHLLVQAHELQSHPLVRKDVKCGTADDEPNAGLPVIDEIDEEHTFPAAVAQGGGNLASGDGGSDTSQMNQQDKPHESVEHASGQGKDGEIMPRESSDIDFAAGDSGTLLPNKQASGQLGDGNHMPRESSDIKLVAGDSGTLLPNQENRPHEFVEHASRQLEDGSTMPRESSDIDLTTGDSYTPPIILEDKSHEDVECYLGQHKDGITMPQESSDVDVPADEDNGPVGDQQKDIIAEQRGKKRFREEEKTSGSINVNCDGSLSSLANSTLVTELSEENNSATEQENLNTNPLLYNLVHCSHSLGENPSGGHKEPLTSCVPNGESSKNVPPCFESMERDNFSDKEVKACKEEPQGAGLCAGESKCKGTGIPHCAESMKEDSRRPGSNSHFLDKGKFEATTSTIGKQNEPCSQRQQRVVVRKVPISRAMKLYAFRY